VVAKGLGGFDPLRGQRASNRPPVSQAPDVPFRPAVAVEKWGRLGRGLVGLPCRLGSPNVSSGAEGGVSTQCANIPVCRGSPQLEKASSRILPRAGLDSEEWWSRFAHPAASRPAT